ncbi:MAG: hypothetical protein M0P73_17040 [Syntrophobacterales bacterium]|nr:hypothetical protein [Syntrophobacterales bacterium]
MRINCLSCGFKVELDDVYDDFEGQVKCFVCGAMLEILTDEGMLKKIKLAPAPPLTGARPGRVGGMAAT